MTNISSALLILLSFAILNIEMLSSGGKVNVKKKVPYEIIILLINSDVIRHCY